MPVHDGRQPTMMPSRPRKALGGRHYAVRLGAIFLALALGFGAYAMTGKRAADDAPQHVAPTIHHVAQRAILPTELGINLFGPDNFYRQQVYLNLIAQSEWFSSRGQGWTPMLADQLDENGWVRRLQPGQTAPRPFVLPPPPFRPVQVRCEYQGQGEIWTGGVARILSHEEGLLILELAPTGVEDGAWIELLATDPADPVRDIDCRETTFSRDERFHPAFLDSIKGFKTIRFLDWQRINDNAPVSWSRRVTPRYSSQVSAGGASIEDMVDIANRTRADPWFLMPYRADEAYIRAFAELVHARLDPDRTVYVELGNEVWNDMFDAAQQARREGIALNLGDGDPSRAQALRYAQKTRVAMNIWTEVFADRPGQLVRVAASQHAWPELADVILAYQDTADWVDVLATAPYIWFDLDGLGVSDLDRIFAAMPGAVDKTMVFAERNREIAARHGKGFIAYEGGQHLVTSDLDLARAVQRDPRMGEVYQRYLAQWDKRIGGTLTLYASNAPIGEYGSWGLTEYGGQSLELAPKLRAVRHFQARSP